VAQRFAETLRRHTQEVAALERAQGEEFLNLLKALRTTLEGRLSAIGDTGSLDAIRIRQITAETEAGIAVLERRGQKQFAAGASDAVELGVDHLLEQFDKLSRTFDAHPLAVELDAAKALADTGQTLLANHFQTSLSRYGGELLNRVRQKLFIGLRTGEPVGPLTRSIAGERGPFGRVGRESAERLMRTETSNAYGAAVHHGIAQAAKTVPGLKKTWLHTGSYPCPICIKLDHTSRPMNGTWSFKGGKRMYKVAHPPAHPHCVCRLLGLRDAWKSGLAKLGLFPSQK
jgi:hypothetical protein